MPHHLSKLRAEIAGIDLKTVANDAGIHYLDPGEPVEDLLDEIAASETVLAEAIHAAIIADSLRIPWVPLQLFDHIAPFKWQDWLGSLSMSYEPVSSQTKAAEDIHAHLTSALTSPARLSDAFVLEAKVDQLKTALEQVPRDFPARARTPYNPATAESENGSQSRIEWLKDSYRLRADLKAVIKPGSAVVLLGDYALEINDEDLDAHIVVPEDEDGNCCVPPVSGVQIVEAVSRAVRDGVEYLTLAWTSFWWLDVLPGAVVVHSVAR